MIYDLWHVLHCEEVPAPEFYDFSAISMEYDDFHEEWKTSASEGGKSVFHSTSAMPNPFKQEELSDFIRDIN